MRAYQAHGWPVTVAGRTILLATGTVVDALEIPGTAGALATSEPQHTPGTISISWHAAGSQVPVPPSADRSGRQAAWAHLPAEDLELPSAIVLLDLLAKAAAATRPYPRSLLLAHGVQAVPAVAGSPAGL